MGHFGSHGTRYHEFTVPGSNDEYAEEVLYLEPDVDGGGDDLDIVDHLRVVVNSLPADADIELDILKPGEDPELSASWETAVVTWSSEGLQDAEHLVAAMCRIRAKSGGTSGTAAVTVGWEA